MDTTLHQIQQTEYGLRDKEKLAQNLQQVCELLAPVLSDEEKSLLREDLDFYLERGRWGVHNTFMGGIIFLREPEIIKNIRIEFDSRANKALPSVEYGSEKRNARNVKYKPDAGKIESTDWNLLGILPGFSRHRKEIQLVLMAIIGRIIQRLCEDEKKNGWFMKFEKPFDIELFLDGRLELTYHVAID